jgi:hypothetical protein
VSRSRIDSTYTCSLCPNEGHLGKFWQSKNLHSYEKEEKYNFLAENLTVTILSFSFIFYLDEINLGSYIYIYISRGKSMVKGLPLMRKHPVPSRTCHL